MPADTLTAHLDAFREAALACPLPAAVELIGEKWAFLILRGAFNGLKHFEEFQAGSGHRPQHPLRPPVEWWPAAFSSGRPTPMTTAA